MTEDRAFNAFVKAKLEEDIALPALHRPAAESLAWWRLAASLAVLCSVFVWRYCGSDEDCRECDSVMAIDFLEACEGSFDSASSSVPFAERLLAWQDAPYAELTEL